MEAGALRNRITIQEKSITRDTYGAETITWVTFCESWANIVPLSGREFMEGRQIQAELDTRIEMRYRNGIKAEMRVLWGSHIYDIKVPPIHVETRGRELHLMCREQL